MQTPDLSPLIKDVIVAVGIEIALGQDGQVRALGGLRLMIIGVKDETRS
jgi:hypothetical protein